MFPILSISTLQVVGSMDNNPFAISKNDSDVFIENFEDTLYRGASTDTEGWGTGTVTNERDYSLMTLDFYATLNPVRDLEIQGRKAFAVGWNDTYITQSVMAFDINNPLNIRMTSYRNSMTGLDNCKMDGDLFYAGTIDNSFADGIAWYNVSKTYDLNSGGVFISNAPCGPVTDISVQGHHVYYTSFNDSLGHSLRILKNFDPTLETLYTPNWASTNLSLGLEVDRHLAYIAASTDGFYVANVSNKYNFVELGHLPLPGNATEVFLDGNIAYVTLAEGGIAAIGVADPTNPVLLDIYDTPGTTKHMALQGNTLFVTDGAEGLIVLDVVDPTHISYVTGITTPSYCWDVELMDAFVYLGTDQGLRSFKLASVSGGITDFSTTVKRSIDTGFNVSDVKVIGDIAYIVGLDTFYTMNVRDPLNPYLLDTYIGAHNYKELEVNGQFAHLISNTGEVIIDVTDPQNLQYIDLITGATMNDLLNIGGLSYVAMSDSIAIGNDTLPANGFSLFDNYAFGTNSTCIDVDGRFIYVGQYLGGVGDGWYVFDYRDPNNIQLVYTRPGLTSNHQELYCEGDILYAANGRWLHLWNISDLSSVYMLDYINYGVDDVVTDVMPFGHYVLITKNNLGAAVVSADNPSDIIELSSYTDATVAKNFDLEGDYMYIANSTSLVVLRFFESAGDTYLPTSSIAQSGNIFTMPNGTILSATLDADYYSNLPNPNFLEFEMSADGGANWQVFGLGVEYNFTNQGRELQWRVTFNGETHKSPHLYSVVINFEFEYDEPTGDGPLSPLWIGIIAGAGGLVLIAIIVTTVVILKKKKTPTR